MKDKSEIQLQREYYSRTSAEYDRMHTASGTDPEHDLACSLISAFSLYYGFRSILDVGSGTGRALANLGRSLPGVKVIGVEPVEALRRIGHQNGISENSLIDGDAMKLSFKDSSFDIVCELGVLHHMPNPRAAIAEMLRVSNKAIFISDSNRFGQGCLINKYIKFLLWRVGLWPLANWIKTRGKGYQYTEGDGVAYSYSVFDDYDFISRQCDKITIVNLDGSGRCSLLGAPHIGLLAFKKI